MTAAAPSARLQLVRDYGTVLCLVALAVALALSTGSFLTRGNLINVLDQSVMLGILACGATLCVICGVFDLSMGAVLACSAIAAVVGTEAAGVPVGFAVGIATGALLGLFNGVVVNLFRVHSFIATLANSIVFTGLATAYTGGRIVYPRPEQLESFQALSWPTALAGVTGATLLFVAVLAVSWFLLAGTTFGRKLYAIGGNEEAARLSGISTDRVRVAAFMISGVCAALAGIVLATRGGSAQASMEPLAALMAIAATVVGGTSILGGEGAVWRALVGVLLLTLIGNGFNLLGWDTTYRQIVQGGLILVAVSLDQYLRRRRR